MTMPDLYPTIALRIYRGHFFLEQGYRRMTVICNMISRYPTCRYLRIEMASW